MSLALHNIAGTYDGNIPPAYGFFPPGQGASADWQQSGAEGSLYFHILPFIEQDNMYKAAATGTSGHLGYQLEWANLPRVVKTYIAPSDPTASSTNPFCSYRTNGLAFCDPPGNQTSWTGTRLPASFSDGTSNTVCFAESFGRPGGLEVKWFATMDDGSCPNGGRCNGPIYFVDGPPNYTNPPIYTGVAINCTTYADRIKPQVLSTGGIQVALADGSVRRVASSISAQTWFLANHPSDGLPLGSDW